MAAYLSWLLSEHQRAVHKARELKPINCPEGTSENTRPWQKMGMIRYCEPDINGRVQIWTEGYLEAEGEFRNGKEHGRWIFDPAGKYKRKRIVVYDNGLQLSEERTEQ